VVLLSAETAGNKSKTRARQPAILKLSRRFAKIRQSERGGSSLSLCFGVFRKAGGTDFQTTGNREQMANVLEKKLKTGYTKISRRPEDCLMKGIWFGL
jgi:hypothetical protein